jgi:hypothetical protein
MPSSDNDKQGVDPAYDLLVDPLREESRRNRRALLAVASICLAIRISDSFPQQISALGISFSNKDVRIFSAMAVALEVYLCGIFMLSASADFFLWRRPLHVKLEAYTANRSNFSLDQAVRARRRHDGKAAS